MKWSVLFLGLFTFFTGCTNRTLTEDVPFQGIEFTDLSNLNLSFKSSALSASDIQLSRELLFSQYTLDDVYPYKDTVRSIKWNVIRQCLAYVENIQQEQQVWCVLQNYKNFNREAPLVRRFVRNEYKRVSDTLGVERYQSVPLYQPSDTLVPIRYGRDGSIAAIYKEEGSFYHIRPASLSQTWCVPKRYVKKLKKNVAFHHVVVVDRGDQNIVTVERVGLGEWKIRSVNPATTGRKRPPFAQETPLGLFLIQQKKERMLYLKDGSGALGGFAPYASRFTNGAYIHGVPVNVPRKSMIEYSWSLGTVPRSHMCVRNATSHARFIFDWAPVEESLVLVIE